MNNFKVGDVVKAGNMFGLKYNIIAIEGKRCTVEHDTGEKMMRGGKWIPEVFTYHNICVSTLSKVD